MPPTIPPIHRLALPLGAVLAASCGAADRAPSVLLVTVDCLRADRVGAYGYERPTTPHLDALAAESALFERSYSHAPFTAPSHASLLTGLNTPSHGLVFWGHQIDPAAATFQDLFGAAGHRTAAFLNHPGLPPTGLLDDFELTSTQVWGPYGETVENFFDWVDSGDGQFAAWVHLWDVHRPYGYREWTAENLSYFPGTGRQPGRLPYAESGFGPEHDGRVGRLEAHYNVNRAKRSEALPLAGGGRRFVEADWSHIADRYDNSVVYADRGVGALVDGLRERGALDRTLVVITADHGETLREREGVWFTHDPYLYEETLRVPLVVRFPGGRFGGDRVADQLARGIDVLPTMLEVAGLDAPDAIQGRSLVGVLDGTDTAPVTLLAQTQNKTAKGSDRSADPSGNGPEWVEYRQAVTDGRHKLIVDYDSGSFEFYDLEQDPGERQNLATGGELGSAGQALRDALQAYRSELPTAVVKMVDQDQAQTKLLEAMGYIEAGEE